MGAMHFASAGKTDVGRARGHNEDFKLEAPDLGLFVVCDGMGGHAAGEVASKAAAETVQRYVSDHRQVIDGFDGSEPAVQNCRRILREAIEVASSTIFEMGKTGDGKHGMGTTCVALLLVGGKAIMGHVGDSRLYLQRDGQLWQLTEDHTYLNDAVKHGWMTPEQAAVSQYAHMVTRGVGVQASVAVDTMVWDTVAGDTYLLCSDGLHGYFENANEIADVLVGEDLDAMVDHFVDTSNARGGKDNITALVVRMITSDQRHAAEMARKSEVTADLKTLRYIGLFLDLDNRELVQVLNAFAPAEFDEGQSIIKEGDSDESLFVLVEGTCDVQRGGKTIKSLSAGTHFGEMALLSRRPRSASVVASSPARVLRLERYRFNEVLLREPQIAVKFLWKLAQILSQRLDDVYLVGDDQTSRKTLEIEMLSPFRRKRS